MSIFSQLPIFGAFLKKIVLCCDGFFKSYIVSYIPNKENGTLHLKIGQHLASQWVKNWNSKFYQLQFYGHKSPIFTFWLWLELDLIFFCLKFFSQWAKKNRIENEKCLFFTVVHFWRVFYKNDINLWWIFKVIFYFSHS